MNQAEALRLFKEANRLWFGEAQYNKVLPLYREALKHDSSDPVILYQLANVLWAFEKFDEMRAVLKLAEQYQDRLSEIGKEIFAEGKQRLLNQSSFRGSLPIPTDEIAFKKLESMGLSHKQWLDVAYAADERKMFSLAADAHDRSMPFIDSDTERDRREMEKENRRAFRELEVMRLEAEK